LDGSVTCRTHTTFLVCSFISSPHHASRSEDGCGCCANGGENSGDRGADDHWGEDDGRGADDDGHGEDNDRCDEDDLRATTERMVAASVRTAADVARMTADTSYTTYARRRRG
jgi:hypothetical protein